MALLADSGRQALVLDFDGVVVSTEWLQFESWNAAFEELLGLRVSGSYRQLVGLTLAEIYALWCRAAGGPPLVLSEAMKQKLLDRKNELYFSLGAGRLSLMPGLVELVHRARTLDWYVMVVSRGKRLRVLRTLEMIKTPLVFDLVMGCEDAVEPTTDRKEHSRAAASFGIDPAHCLVIEDSASGVQAARACGIGYVIGLATDLDPIPLLAAGAHTTVDHLDQVQLGELQRNVL